MQVLLGPVESAVHDEFTKHADVISYETSEELQHLLNESWPQHDVLFMAAAVSDLRPAEASPSKLPRAPISIQFDPVPDLLADLADRWPSHGIRIGFALEHQDQLLDRARRKLDTKNCHAIAANPLDTVGSEIVSGTWVTPEGHVTLAEQAKSEYAIELLDRSLQLWSRTSG